MAGKDLVENNLREKQTNKMKKSIRKENKKEKLIVRQPVAARLERRRIGEKKK